MKKRIKKSRPAHVLGGRQESAENRGHGGAVSSDFASQPEGPGFDSRWGRCGRWGRVLSSASSVPIP